MTRTGLERVTVVRSGRTVLDEVTLQAADGELLVVLGPSGSGKSTLLRVLSGLDPVSSGEVVIRGRRVTDLPAPGRRTAMVFEASALIPFLDVARNLGWGLRVQGVPEDDVRTRVGRRARQLRLDRLLPRRPSALSGGERGLVGIGHALVQSPEVFLFDEPLGVLDGARRAEVRRQIVDVVRSLGVPAFYVTHDQAEALAVADRLALLHEGRVVQVGPPMELYRRPVDLFVAGFVGEVPIGLLPARLVSADGQAGYVVGDRTLPLWRPVPAPLRSLVGRDVVLGFRPEDVLPAGTGSDPHAVTLEALVTDVQFTGRRDVVCLAVDAPPAVVPGDGSPGPDRPTATLRSFFPVGSRTRPGDDVRIAVEAARASVFDPGTGQALWHPDGEPDGIP